MMASSSNPSGAKRALLGWVATADGRGELVGDTESSSASGGSSINLGLRPTFSCNISVKPGSSLEKGAAMLVVWPSLRGGRKLDIYLVSVCYCIYVSACGSLVGVGFEGFLI